MTPLLNSTLLVRMPLPNHALDKLRRLPDARGWALRVHGVPSMQERRRTVSTFRAASPRFRTGGTYAVPEYPEDGISDSRRPLFTLGWNEGVGRSSFIFFWRASYTVCVVRRGQDEQWHAWLNSHMS
jgi:hypothetical protein